MKNKIPSLGFTVFRTPATGALIILFLREQDRCHLVSLHPFSSQRSYP